MLYETGHRRIASGSSHRATQMISNNAASLLYVRTKLALFKVLRKAWVKWPPSVRQLLTPHSYVPDAAFSRCTGPRQFLALCPPTWRQESDMWGDMWISTLMSLQIRSECQWNRVPQSVSRDRFLYWCVCHGTRINYPLHDWSGPPQGMKLAGGCFPSYIYSLRGKAFSVSSVTWKTRQVAILD